MININKKSLINSNFIIMMIILSLFACILKNYNYSLFLVVLWVYLFNYILKKEIDIKIYIFINIYILINIILIIISTNQAINLGYYNGILHGNIMGVQYNDAYNYYNNTLICNNIDIIEYIKKFMINMRSDNYLYNIFILYNLVISKIFGNSIEVLLISKLIFSVISLNLLARICGILNIKRKLMAIILYAFYPGTLSININFLRDGFIVFFIILIIYSYLKIIIDNDKNRKYLIYIVIGFVFMLILRLYSAVSLGISIFIFTKSRNFKTLFLKFIICFLGIFLINNVSIIFGYGIFGLNYMNKYMGGIGIVKSIIETIVRLIFGFSIIVDSLKSGILSNVFLMISPIYIFLVNMLLIGLIILRHIKLNIITKKILLFYFVFSFSNGLLLVLRDGIIVERIYAMWIWIPIIVISNFQTKKLIK